MTMSREDVLDILQQSSATLIDSADSRDDRLARELHTNSLAQLVVASTLETIAEQLAALVTQVEATNDIHLAGAVEGLADVGAELERLADNTEPRPALWRRLFPRPAPL